MQYLEERCLRQPPLTRPTCTCLQHHPSRLEQHIGGAGPLLWHSVEEGADGARGAAHWLRLRRAGKRAVRRAAAAPRRLQRAACTCCAIIAAVINKLYILHSGLVWQSALRLPANAAVCVCLCRCTGAR
jgi:hypothetical protein